jgi:hypothetical protein
MPQQIQSHIQTKDDYLDRRARELAYTRELAADEARTIERAEDDALSIRVARSLARGESEETFEIAEEAMQLARQRSIDFVNGEITRIFAGAIAAVKTAEERRAA